MFNKVYEKIHINIFYLSDGIVGRTELYEYATHTKATPWFMGFLLGYFLHLKSKTDIKINKVNTIVIQVWISI